MKIHKLARGLGWFSIGIGLAELAATKKVGAALRLEDRPRFLRSCGMREIATGVGILTRARRAPWLWARVAGDAVDLAAAGKSFRRNKGSRGKIATGIAAIAGITALDLFCCRRLGKLHS